MIIHDALFMKHAVWYGVWPMRTTLQRRLTFGLLYFSEGAPIGFIWWAMPTLLRGEGLAIDRITALTSTLLLPWILKFLWAPLIDMVQSPRWTLKHWILSAQTMMVLPLIPLCFLSPIDHFSAWMTMLVIHGFAAATQDASIDALAIRTVPESEKGMINGSMQIGMLIGRSLFGGAILVAAHRLGFQGVIALLAGCVTLVMGVVIRIPTPPVVWGRGRHVSGFFGMLGSAFRYRSTWAGLCFALTSGAAFEAAGAMAGPILLDTGAAQHTVGTFLAVPVVLAMVLGALVGGFSTDRLGARRSSAFFLVGFTVVVAMIGQALIAHADIQRVLVLLGTMYFFIGMFTAASYTLFMHLTTPALGATQFCLFMAGTNACEAWSGRIGGSLAADQGYGPALLVLCAVSLASLVILPLLKRGSQEDIERASRPHIPTAQ